MRWVLAVCIVLAAYFWGDLPAYTTGEEILAPPSPHHILGTNDLGEDVLLGIIHGAPVTIGIALITAVLAMVLAIIAAAMVALAPGRIGRAVLAFVDLLQVVPTILLLLLFAAWHQPNAVGIILLLSATTWHDDVRILRSLMLREANRESLVVAKSMGWSNGYCVRRHILPALMPALVGLYVQNALQAAMRAAGLAFLGLTDPRLVTWGGMVGDAVDHLHGPERWWLLGPPTLMFSLFLGGLMVINHKFSPGHQTSNTSVSN